jgi:hypothetical protein
MQFLIKHIYYIMLVGLMSVLPPAIAAELTVITLTQAGCQFLESENGVDRGFHTTKAEDCNTINAKTGKNYSKSVQT